MAKTNDELMTALSHHVRTRGKVILSETGDGLHDDCQHGSHFVVGSEWGQEAPDSPMAGAAAYGVGESLEEALEQMLTDAGEFRKRS